MDKKLSYCSQQQKTMLLDMLKSQEYEILVSGKFSANFTHKESQKKWEELTEVLNSIPGSKKDWKHWRKTWQDIRSKTKKRKVEQVRHCKGTGGGPSCPEYLTETDEKVLSMMSQVEVLGNQEIAETDIDFIYENESDPSFVMEEGFDIPLNVCKKQSLEQSTTPNINTTTFKDHGYSLEPSTSKGVTKPKKQTAASQRLKESTSACKALTEVARDKLDYKVRYYDKKLELLERQVCAIENIVELLKENFC